VKKIKYLRPLFLFAIIVLVITNGSRLILFLVYKDRIVETANYGLMFPVGLHMDLILLSYLCFLPAAILSLVPDKFLKYFTKFLTGYFILFLFIYFFMELITPQFLDQYDTRPNRLFLDYLIYPETYSLLIKEYPVAIVFVALFAALFIYFGYKDGRKFFSIPATPYKYRLILMPLLFFFLIWGARGSLTTRWPVRPSSAVFSNDQFTNSMSLNSFYTVFYAAYGMKYEQDISKLYGYMDEQEAYNRVKKYMNVEEDKFTDPDIPLLHEQIPDTVLQRPYNVVIFLQESLGAEYVGCLGGMPLTPEFDKLAEEGMLFTNLYCTGTRSIRGIEAVVSGYLPSPSSSVVKLSNSQIGFFTLAETFKRSDFDTSFIYGGMANYDNMASFFNGNGFENILDETVFDKDDKPKTFKGIWGYCDEDMVIRANDYYKSQGDKPFFSLIFSLSNHTPFEFPDGSIDLFEEPKNTPHNTTKYADFALGKFFELAKKEDYFKNTVFIMVADHNIQTSGKHLVPIHKFHIPALIIGPNVEKGSRYERLCSQIDIAPTLLNVAGIKAETPMPGRDLLNMGETVQGRAMMQFHDINAFRVENKVVVMQPKKEPLQFELQNDTTFIPVPLDPELAKDALAHVLSAGYLYKGKKYRLPEDN